MPMAASCIEVTCAVKLYNTQGTIYGYYIEWISVSVNQKGYPITMTLAAAEDEF